MEKPNLELPRRAAASRPIFDRRSTFFFIVGVAGFAIVIWAMMRGGARGSPTDAGHGEPVAADQIEKLALRLEDKNLDSAAADAWGDYLAAAAPTPEKAIQVHTRIGRLLAKAHRYEDAIAHFYRAEMVGATGQPSDSDVAMDIRDCFRALGRYGESAREAKERTSLTKDEGGLAGGQIVAEIGDEKITVAEFDRLVHDEVEQTLAASPDMSEAQAESIRRRAHEQFATPEGRSQLLQQVVVRRVLSHEARQRGIEQDAAFRRRLDEQTDGLLVNQLVGRVAHDRAGVTREDAKRYYEANRARYETPAHGRLARIVCPDKKKAEHVLELLKGGADFAKLAGQHSTDAATREHGGALDGEIQAEGESVPGVGEDAKLHEKLWKLGAGATNQEPLKSTDGWVVYKMVEKTEARTPPFEQVAERVEAECGRARRGEVLQQFIGEMFEKYRVRLNPGAMSATQPASPSNAKKP